MNILLKLRLVSLQRLPCHFANCSCHFLLPEIPLDGSAAEDMFFEETEGKTEERERERELFRD